LPDSVNFDAYRSLFAGGVVTQAHPYVPGVKGAGLLDSLWAQIVLWPLQLVLRTYVINDTQLGSAELGTELLPPQAAIQMAILVISIVPILIVHPFLQRHFAKGLLTGAVKG
jgi:hypothetical protein